MKIILCLPVRDLGISTGLLAKALTHAYDQLHDQRSVSYADESGVATDVLEGPTQRGMCPIISMIWEKSIRRSLL